MKTAKKTSKKNTKTPKVYHLLVYVEKCETKVKKFKTLQDLGVFIDSFLKRHPDYADTYSDYWLDYSITNVSGEVNFFTDNMRVQ
jgi:hypothetical protein